MCVRACVCVCVCVCECVCGVQKSCYFGAYINVIQCFLSRAA